MKHAINPMVDCVFKSLLGSWQNRNLLVHFINATLSDELVEPVTSVDIENPYNDRTFLDDKLSIVDVKASDAQQRIYQLEIQLVGFANLPSRMLYTWSTLYGSQVRKGDHFDKLLPTYAIWLLGGRIRADDPAYMHHYKMRDCLGRELVQHGGIWVLELEKFHSACTGIASELERWLRFFKEGVHLDDEALPYWMMTTEMRQAMDTLRRFSDQERDFHAYQARETYIRQQRTIELEREQAQLAIEHAQQEIEQAQQAIEESRLEIEESRLEIEESRLEIKESRLEIEERQLEIEERQLAIEKEQENLRIMRKSLEESMLEIQAKKEQNEDEIAKVQTEREQAQADIAKAQAEREQAQAENQQAQEALERMRAELTQMRSLREAEGKPTNTG